MLAKRSPASAAGPGRDLVCPWLHTEVTCDGCRASPISGYRYKCEVRPNFDLCSKCVRKESCEAQRHFVRIGRCEAASKPYQIYYVECQDCGVSPVKGPRYRHKTDQAVDLCEGCFQRATSSRHALESDFEKIEESRIKALRKKPHPALHFDKSCDECRSCPIVGPCFTLIKNPNYDVCAYCHDQLLAKNEFRDGDFLVAAHPRPSATFHLNIISCGSCGVFPICGPSYQHQRKVNKSVCLLCYFHVKKEKKAYFNRVEPPLGASNVKQANGAPTAYPAPRSTHPMSRNNSAPAYRSTPPPVYARKSSSFHQEGASGTGPPPAASYQYPNQPSYSESLRPSRSGNAYPGSYPAQGTPAASYSQNLRQSYSGAQGARPNYMASANQPALTEEERMMVFYRYYLMQSAQRQQEIQAFMRKHEHASDEVQNQFMQQFVQNIISNSLGGGGGGGGFGAGGGGGGVDFSSLFGGNTGGGVDYSSLFGGNTGGGVDYSSLFGGNTGGGVDYSSLMGGAGGVDYSSLMGGGGGVDYASLMGGAGGVDYSSILGGAGGVDGGGVLSSLLGAFTGLGFS